MKGVCGIRPAALLASLAVAASFALGGSGASASESAIVLLSAAGILQPARTVDAPFQSSGLVAEVRVTIGEHVRRGELLARLDARPAKRALRSAQAALAAAKRRLATLRRTLAHLRRQQVRAAQKLQADKRALSAARASKLAHEKHQLELQGRQEQVNASLAVHQEQLQEAIEAGDERAIAAARAAIAQDRAQLAAIQDGLTTVAITLLDDGDALERLQDRLSDDNATLTELKSTTASDESGLTAGGEAAAAATDKVASARAALAQTVLYAPISGLVAALHGVPGATVAGGAGGSPASGGGSGGGAFATIVTEALQVQVAFDEIDASKLYLGQAATVSVSALDNELLPAHIIAIAPTATGGKGSASYAVVLALDRSEHALKSGMTVQVRVRVDER